MTYVLVMLSNPLCSYSFVYLIQKFVQKDCQLYTMMELFLSLYVLFKNLHIITLFSPSSFLSPTSHVPQSCFLLTSWPFKIVVLTKMHTYTYIHFPTYVNSPFNPFSASDPYLISGLISWYWTARTLGPSLQGKNTFLALHSHQLHVILCLGWAQ